MDETLFIHWLFTSISMVIMIGRLVGRKYIFRKFDIGDYFTMAAVVCASARAGMIHYVLTWGTNNLNAKARAKIHFTPDEIYRRKIGSQLAIANRPVYNSYLWLQKLVLLYLYSAHFLVNGRRKTFIITLFGTVFFATYVAAQVIGFTECDPFHLYWQVLPPPGTCVQAQMQLIVLGSLNILTDVMLLVLPIPVIISLQTSWKRKLQLSGLCTVGVFIIIVTLVRLPINHINATSQVNRSTWASIELLAAAIVANAATYYGLFNTHRQKRRKASARSRPSDYYSSSYSNSDSKSGIGTKPRTLSRDNESEEVMLNVLPGSSGASHPTLPSPGHDPTKRINVTQTTEVAVHDHDVEKATPRRTTIGSQWNYGKLR